MQWKEKLFPVDRALGWKQLWAECEAAALMGKIFTFTPRGWCACRLLPKSYPCESDKPHLGLQMTWPPILPSAVLHAYTQTESDWPYKCPASFSSRFQPKINRFLEENGCKTLSLLSSPFVQSHFKAITGNNRNNQTFIPCKTRSLFHKTRSSPQNKLFILQQQKWVMPHRQEGQSWFCFTICRQKNKIISYFGGYHKCLSRRITFGIQHISFIWGGKVVPLSWSSPERFLSCQAYKMSQNAPTEKYKSNDDFPNQLSMVKIELE